MAGGPYYGDPDLLREANRNIKSLKDMSDVDWLAKVDLYDPLIVQIMLSRLRPYFLNLPVPASQCDSILSVLWMWEMTYYLQTWAFSTNVVDAKSNPGEGAHASYVEMMQAIMLGTAVIDGTNRVGFTPKISQTLPQRLIATDGVIFTEDPIVFQSLYRHGLRN